MSDVNENEVASPITIMIVVIIFLGFSYAILSNKAIENQSGKIEYNEIGVENGLIESGKVDNSSLNIQSSTNKKNNDCLIKGNIGKDGTKIYHLPGNTFYEKTSIDITAGERWFCNEEDAVDAGWRKEEASTFYDNQKSLPHLTEQERLEKDELDREMYEDATRQMPSIP